LAKGRYFRCEFSQGKYDQMRVKNAYANGRLVWILGQKDLVGIGRTPKDSLQGFPYHILLFHDKDPFGFLPFLDRKGDVVLLEKVDKILFFHPSVTAWCAK
jgi:hypothetical protein